MEDLTIIDCVKILKKTQTTTDQIQKFCDNVKNSKLNTNDVYEVVGNIINKTPLFENIHFKSKCFQKYIKEEEEYLNFLNCPEVDEGIYQCNKCKSKKIYKFSKQTRAGDESTTVFAMCTSCKNKWII